ncbi:adenosine receptor A1-like [Xenia sp. Carnegie-2017]|uniref:adenosine receptor A1-like n=1 Tax=Xenia sp. Carnegie-2017 TaxID=2897299 RepID=UPI001F040944|nr:adenosine receptor A1-like [Xenia sp. Carnegie-2017]
MLMNNSKLKAVSSNSTRCTSSKYAKVPLWVALSKGKFLKNEFTVESDLKEHGMGLDIRDTNVAKEPPPSLCILLVTIFYGKLLANRWNQVNREHKEHMNQETKLTKVVFMLIALLVITTVPTIVHYQVIYGLALFCGVDCIHENFFLVPVCLTSLFSANFAINPIVYAWRLPKYRRSFLALWKSIFLCQNLQAKI